MTTGLYATKTALGTTMQNMGTLQPSIDTNTFWQLQANLLNTSFVGDLTQAMNFRVNCDGGSGGGQPTSATFSDDFASYSTQAAADASWVPNDPAQAIVDVTNDNLKVTYTSETSVNSIAHDLGSTSDSAWVLRFSSKLTSASQYPTFFFGLHSTPQTTTIGVGQSPGDSLNWMFQGFNGAGGDGNLIRAYDNNVSVVNSASWGTLSLNTVYYFQLTRLSPTSFEGKVFTDAGYATQVGPTMTITVPNTITGLRYLKGANYIDTAAIPGTLNMVIDDIEFYDGVTSVPTTPQNPQPISYPDGLGPAADATISGSPTRTVAGKLGSYATTGVNGAYAAIPNSSTNLGFLSNGDYSLSFWIKKGTGDMILGSTPGASGWHGVIYYLTDGGTFYATRGGSGHGTGGESWNKATGIADSNWHHITITGTSTPGQSKLYIDGTELTGLSYSYTSSLGGADHQSNLTLYGYGDFTGGVGTYNESTHTLDEFSIWNRVLAQSEISQLYNSGAGNKPSVLSNLSGLKAYYDFEQTSGNLINQAKP